MERRNSNRVCVADLNLTEKNGDYLFQHRVENLSEEGVYVTGKMVTAGHHYLSHLTLHLGPELTLENIPAKIIRESFGAGRTGVVFHFVNMNEATRIELKKFLLQHRAA